MPQNLPQSVGLEAAHCKWLRSILDISFQHTILNVANWSGKVRAKRRLG